MVTDSDRALAELVLNPAVAEQFELIPTTINGVECAVASHITVCAEHGMSLRPVFVILNDELFNLLTPPADAETFHG